MINNKNIIDKKNNAQYFIEKKIDIPKGYIYKSYRLFQHDATPVFIFRYEKKNGNNNGLNGEYFSVSVDMDAVKIMGIMHIDSLHCGDGLPNDHLAKEQGLSFLNNISKDLYECAEVKWIAPLLENPKKIPHESPFRFYDKGEKKLVTGVRVKLFFKKYEAWGWVIVGRQGKIISFEREIIWNSIMNKRSTAAWLHDEYLSDLLEDISNL